LDSTRIKEKEPSEKRDVRYVRARICLSLLIQTRNAPKLPHLSNRVASKDTPFVKSVPNGSAVSFAAEDKYANAAGSDKIARRVSPLNSIRVSPISRDPEQKSLILGLRERKKTTAARIRASTINT